MAGYRGYRDSADVIEEKQQDDTADVKKQTYGIDRLADTRCSYAGVTSRNGKNRTLRPVKRR